MCKNPDNINTTVKEDLQSVIHKESKLSIAAACFSIYAYQELKKLKKIYNSDNYIYADNNHRLLYASISNREKKDLENLIRGIKSIL